MEIGNDIDLSQINISPLWASPTSPPTPEEQDKLSSKRKVGANNNQKVLSPSSSTSPHGDDRSDIVMSKDSEVAKHSGTVQIIPTALLSTTRPHSPTTRHKSASTREQKARSLFAQTWQMEVKEREEEADPYIDNADLVGAGLQRGLRSTSYRRAMQAVGEGGEDGRRRGWATRIPELKLDSVREEASSPVLRKVSEVKGSLQKMNTFDNSTDTVLYQQYRECGLNPNSEEEADKSVLPPQPDPNVVLTYRASRLMWRQLPQVNDSEILKKLSAEERKRQEAIFEIITSEHSYLHSLDVLIRVFFHSADLRIMANKIEIHHLFSNILDVRETSKRFFKELEERHKLNVFMESVSDIVEKHAREHFEPYVKYCANEVYQQRMLLSLQLNKNFKDMLQKLESHPDCNSLTLVSFLILPMQRATRLPLLMDTVCQKTNKQSEEYQKALCSFKEISKLVKRCNEEARKMERTEQMFQLQKQLQFKIIKAFPLVSASRWLVKSGELTSYVAEGGLFNRRSKGLFCFLFNDVLILTRKRNEDTYLVTDYALSEHVEVEPVEVDESLSPSVNHGQNTQSKQTSPVGLPRNSIVNHLFQVVLQRNNAGERVEMTLVADSLSDRARWVSALTRWQRDAVTSQAVMHHKVTTQMEMVKTHMARQPDEISLQVADVVLVYQKVDGWCEGERLRDGERGWFLADCGREITNQSTITCNVQRRGRLLGLETNV
uniref:rho guanine nucleotide exchange factor 26 n=1 Tax=Myxine glutinosa TaxID=7769 RepID=UPI00358F6BA5